jgi:hypothetical protein
MTLQYHLLFPNGEDGFMLGILRRSVEGTRSNTNNCVTMREYYAYRLRDIH